MSRPVFPYTAPDISLLARSLTKQWAAETATPSHLQILNMLARAVGFQNFQHFRDEAEQRLPATASATMADEVPVATFQKSTSSINADNAHRLLRHFTDDGRLLRWPGKYSEQLPCLWTIWSRIPANREMSEPEVNEFIKLGEALGDHVLLRRELIGYELLQRTIDGRVYRRVEQTMPVEFRDLVAIVLARAPA